MASLDWDKCAGFALTMFSVAVGAFIGAWKVLPPGGRMNWPSAVLLAVSTAFLGAALVLAWLAAVRHPRQLARKAAREKTRAAAEKAAALAEDQARLEERRAKWREPCRAWDEFSYEAHLLVTTLDSYRHDGSPSNWDRIMALKLHLALVFVEAVIPSHREQAKEFLKPFQEARELSLLGFPLAPLRNWLFDVDRYYRDKAS